MRINVLVTYMHMHIEVIQRDLVQGGRENISTANLEIFVVKS